MRGLSEHCDAAVAKPSAAGAKSRANLPSRSSIYAAL